MGIIYIAINNLNGKAYVGKTELSLEKRIQAHYKKAKANRNAGRIETYFHRALLKYDTSSIQWGILEETEDVSEAERKWIAYCKATGIELYNQTNGGDGLPKGYKHKPESIERMRRAKKGQLGKPHTQETKQKIADLHAGRYTFVSPENEIIHVYNMRQFCRAMELDQSAMSKVANGKAKSHKGWTLP